MSNEEVVLKMLINRLEQLLELVPEFKEKWNAEITELIHLGKGVIVETPEPPARATRMPDHVAATYDQDANDDWHLPLTREMIDMLYNTSTFAPTEAYVLQDFQSRVVTLYDNSYDGPFEGDNDPFDDEPEPPIIQAPILTPEMQEILRHAPTLDENLNVVQEPGQ